MLFETTSERLIVSVDTKIDASSQQTPHEQAFSYLHNICRELQGLEVTLKVNTIARILGAVAVEFIHDQGLPCFLDLKLFDIGHTIENDISWIDCYKPSILTISERISPTVLKRVQQKLPTTLVLPVGPLTDMEDRDFAHFNEIDRRSAVKNFFLRVQRCGLKGVICAPIDIGSAPPAFAQNAVFVTPGVKPHWSLRDDNSANSLTPAMAIAAGASAVVVGRGIIDAVDIREAAERTIEEVEQAFSKREPTVN